MRLWIMQKAFLPRTQSRIIVGRTILTPLENFLRFSTDIIIELRAIFTSSIVWKRTLRASCLSVSSLSCKKKKCGMSESKSNWMRKDDGYGGRRDQRYWMYDFDSIGTNYTLAAKDHDTNVFTKVSQRAQSMIAIKVLAHTSSLELAVSLSKRHTAWTAL